MRQASLNGAEPKHRLGIVSDLREEEWPSMDLVVEMLHSQIGQAGGAWTSVVHRPKMPVLPQALRRHNLARQAERLAGRWLSYPASLRHLRGTCDAYHVADHSYAHLVHWLPAGRTGVFCHDIDLFNCLVEPEKYPRPRWFLAMAKVAALGLSRAAVVFHSTLAMRQLIEKYRLVRSDRLVHAPYGVASEFVAEDGADRPASIVPGLADRPFVLHVSSCIPRKRVDVLLEIFARLRLRFPELTLVQVGGSFTPEQRAQISAHRLEPAITQIERLPRDKIAVLYRGAAVTLMTSEAEGFGLPVAEALACGSLVVASDIPSMREAGGSAASYCAVGYLEQWTETVSRLLLDPQSAPSREARLAHAARFSWRAHARTIIDAYDALPTLSRRV